MMKKGVLSLALALAIGPSFAYAATAADGILKNIPDIEQLRAKKATYNFYLFIDKAELKSKGDAFVLVIPKTDRNYQIVYQSTAPEKIAGTMMAADFQKYWADGGSFKKTPPTVIISAADKKGGKRNIDYFVNFTSMNDDGKTISFDVVPMPNQSVKAGQLNGVFVTVDDYGAGLP